MRTKRLFHVAALLIFIGLAEKAAAAEVAGYSGVNLNVRSGPNVRFAAVGLLGAGTSLTIHGCLAGYTWCDISASGLRGWASGAHIQFEYETRRVYVPAYAPRVEMPILTSHIDSYWHDYYRDRPFYDELPRWLDSHWEDDNSPPGWRDNWDDDYSGHEY
ncbi:SH3 domain-containing protein [Bradyrhizobium ontarionense]|uniref:SH3 domain-containing protein n=1 Tax=Bradyrhizobium ontarionense TaxID=2898149 RepID=A0ABY3R359_9BRAD|nr:SH3 domain-containing protein [Bradyrhizobium sp. A19]UFZ01730.1 SH3 domain-containing protein [Bradyrhizobium sp. A19]